jgi:ATP-binding cassette, subfamily C (CFTR/MRP), member 1
VAASRSLHGELARATLRSPLAFFDATPVGRVLNRFSKDLGDLDLMLPDRWQWLLMCSLRVGSILLVLSVVSPLFAACLLPIMALYLHYQVG